MLVSKSNPGNHTGPPRSAVGRRRSLSTSHFFLSILACLASVLLLLPRLTPPPAPDWSSLLPSLAERHEPLRALILTAHPDDECMFFSPTILSLVEQQAHVRALCLSSGNATGIGNVRSEELLLSYAILGVNQSDVTIVNDINLPDTMRTAWNPAIIASVLSRYLDAHPTDIIITFDTGGVTQHPNHTPLSLGIKAQSQSRHYSNPSTQKPRLLTLETVPKRVKFTSILFPFYKNVEYRLRRWMSTTKSATGLIDTSLVWEITSSYEGYITALHAMMQHRSQLVWFRWLYVAFSKYMWSNRLVEVHL